MVEQHEILHHIQKHILSILLRQKAARFRDLRPARVDTNLFSYHLTTLLKSGIVQKGSSGYELSTMGLAYVDRMSTEKFTIRSQPKIVTMTVIKNKKNQILLHKRTKQPFIDTWTLPYGKTHIDDLSIQISAEREVEEKVGLNVKQLVHVGDCYIGVRVDKQLISNTMAHIFMTTIDDEPTIGECNWCAVEDIDNFELAPAVKKILELTQLSQSHFFTEIIEDWK